MAKFGERVFDPKDPQQFRVYKVERETTFSREVIFGSLDEIREEMDRVLASPTWQALRAHTLQAGRDVDLRKGRGKGAKAFVFEKTTPRIIMPPHQWRRWTLFHELAHCVRGKLTCTHGPQFTASYLRLIHDCWSPELAYQLRAKFAQHEVRVHPWWEPGCDIPVPDPATIAIRLDEGAEEEMAQRKERERAEWARVHAIATAYLERRAREKVAAMVKLTGSPEPAQTTTG